MKKQPVNGGLGIDRFCILEDNDKKFIDSKYIDSIVMEAACRGALKAAGQERKREHADDKN